MAPDTGLKTYFVSTAFGGHKVYHTQDTTFWCCSCTGMESFAKLPYGIYYNTDDGVIVNMFYSSTYKVSNDLTIKQTGDFYSTQSTKITVEGDCNFKIKLRVPDWAENGFTVKINGTTQNLTAENGYIVIDRVWNNGDYIDYTVPFSIRLEDLNKDGEYKAMFYGPILMVAKFDAVTDDVRTNQTNVASAYTGSITDNITHLNLLEVNARTSNSDGYYKINLTTQNNGTLNFEPFNRVFHNRYGMYFTYTEIADLSELSSKIADAKLLDTSMYVSSSVTVFNTALTNAENITSANTQLEVNNAISDLDNAIASLVLKGDKTALNAKILEAENLIETDYTASTWANLQTALTIAKAVSDDVPQDTVDTALNALTTAINNLVERDNGGDTSGGDNTGGSGSNDNTGGSENNGGSTGGGMSCSMSLGAETFVIGFMALSIGLFLIIKKIKRRNA